MHERAYLAKHYQWWAELNSFVETKAFNYLIRVNTHAANNNLKWIIVLKIQKYRESI